jgi:hypothetical protein
MMPRWEFVSMESLAGGSRYGIALFDSYAEVLALPSSAVFPEEGEDDLTSRGERFGGQIDVL